MKLGKDTRTGLDRYLSTWKAPDDPSPGFAPNTTTEWDMMGWSDGCIIRTPLNCSTDSFQKVLWAEIARNKKFLKNCSCIAYSTLDIREGGSGCLLWFGDLIDIRQFNEYGQDIYITMAASEIGINYLLNLRTWFVILR
ncbi:hypothetical protein RCOM_1222570 [Ricinus communis]|uniref:Apple domain-containing protein n=1 Tax=Ricinus communis TaxID=3988 RepID=B9S0R9_RICCO|nr:hypothetical protein RCOM_1222570 [Ricinus communis]